MQTPGGPSARTMDVLNDATDILNEINKVRLSVPQWDWSPEIEWWPGDPLYPAPKLVWPACYSGCCPDIYQTEGGQHIRPIFEVFDAEDDFDLEGHMVDCDECEASSDPSENNCWLCGKELSQLWRAHAWQGLTIVDEWNSSIEPYMYAGDEIESFDTGFWARMNDRSPTFEAFNNLTEHVGFNMDPWQASMTETYLQEYAAADVRATQAMMVGGNIDNQGRARLWSVYPRRNAGRALMERMVAELFVDGELVVTGRRPVPVVPTNVEIQNSRRRSPQVQRTYPTSTNPTQQRRRRNA